MEIWNNTIMYVCSYCTNNTISIIQDKSIKYNFSIFKWWLNCLCNKTFENCSSRVDKILNNTIWAKNVLDILLIFRSPRNDIIWWPPLRGCYYGALMWLEWSYGGTSTIDWRELVRIAYYAFSTNTNLYDPLYSSYGVRLMHMQDF